MAKPTLQQRLIDALVATGRASPVDGRSSKYVTLKRADRAYFYVGRNGALRYGRTVTASVAATDAFKQRLLLGRRADALARNTGAHGAPGSRRWVHRPAAVFVAASGCLGLPFTIHSNERSAAAVEHRAAYSLMPADRLQC